jgi:sodium:dicarboxylate symporter family protein
VSQSRTASWLPKVPASSSATCSSSKTCETGIFSVIPTNIFAALSANDSVRVLCFALIFGVSMVMTERQSGYSIFGALRHVQAVCITIFDWFSLLVPIGIVALIAPQIALLGPDALTVLALFGYAFVGKLECVQSGHFATEGELLCKGWYVRAQWVHTVFNDLLFGGCHGWSPEGIEAGQIALAEECIDCVHAVLVIK